MNWGPALTFVDKASSSRSIPRPSSSGVIQLIDQTPVTRPRGESRVSSTLIIARFRVVRLDTMIIF